MSGPLLVHLGFLSFDAASPPPVSPDVVDGGGVGGGGSSPLSAPSGLSGGGSLTRGHAHRARHMRLTRAIGLRFIAGGYAREYPRAMPRELADLLSLVPARARAFLGLGLVAAAVWLASVSGGQGETETALEVTPGEYMSR